MPRLVVVRVLGTFWLCAVLLGCGPDSRPQLECSGQPDFVVTVRSALGPLPTSTRIDVRFGGQGHESYSPKSPNARQVLFCDAYRAGEAGAGAAGSGGEEAGAGGAPTDNGTYRSISCELWTGGPASLSVQASGLEKTTSLTPKANECTGWSDIVLNSKDGDL